MLGDQRLERAHHLVVTSHRQLGFDQVLLRGGMKLVKSGDLDLGEARVVEVRKRCSPPQRERCLQRRGGALRALRRELAPALAHQTLEDPAVDGVRVDPQLVAVLAGDHQFAAGFGTRLECLTKAGDVGLQGLARGRRGLLAPQLVDQALAGEGLVRV